MGVNSKSYERDQKLLQTVRGYYVGQQWQVHRFLWTAMPSKLRIKKKKIAL